MLRGLFWPTCGRGEGYDVLLAMALCVAAVAAEVVSQLRDFFAKLVLLVLCALLLASIATGLLEHCSLRSWCLVLRFPASHARRRKWDWGPGNRQERCREKKTKSGISCEDAVFSDYAMRNSYANGDLM